MIRPFLKWAGGKYLLLQHLANILPKGNRLIEPFAGAGSIFLNLDYPKYYIADNNPDLIQLFKLLKKEGEAFIDYCQQFFIPENNQKEKYYELRACFNKTHECRLKSALFIYLNHHCFNGLCRYNHSGGFNVPFGKYKGPVLPVDKMLHFIKKAKKATFIHQDFEETFKKARTGDVIYCDPPYLPLSKTANFTAYSKQVFTLEKQAQLAHMAKASAKKGIRVVISNHDTPVARELYDGADIISLPVKRTISSKTSLRKPTDELIAVF